MFQAPHSWRLQTVVYFIALLRWSHVVLLADRRALRIKRSPRFGTAVVHMHVVNVTVFAKLWLRAKKKNRRQVQNVTCAVRSPRHLILDIASAGSVFLGCIAETWTHYGFCHKVVALVKVQREFSIGRLCTQLFHLVFVSLALFLFYQCSLSSAKLMGMLAPSLSMFVLTWGFVTDWPDLLGDRCNTRVWDSNTSYMCSALFHLMHHFPQVNLNCHFPSHLSCYWSFIAVQRGISLLIMFFLFRQVIDGPWKEVH